MAGRGVDDAGSVFGGLLAYFFFQLASKERMDRAKLDQQREGELVKQNVLKDKRIDALHEQISLGDH